MPPWAWFLIGIALGANGAVLLIACLRYRCRRHTRRSRDNDGLRFTDWLPR